MGGRAPGDPYYGLGLVESYWYQQRECGDSVQQCLDFVWVESEFYPELAHWFGTRAMQWALDQQIEAAVRIMEAPLESDS